MGHVLAPSSGSSSVLPLVNLVLGCAVGSLVLAAGALLGNVAVRGLSTLREGLLLAGLGFVIATLTRNPWIVPERKRQVVGDWAAEGLAQASLRWGVELGMGVRLSLIHI